MSTVQPAHVGFRAKLPSFSLVLATSSFPCARTHMLKTLWHDQDEAH